MIRTCLIRQDGMTHKPGRNCLTPLVAPKLLLMLVGKCGLPTSCTFPRIEVQKGLKDQSPTVRQDVTLVILHVTELGMITDLPGPY
ncbi:hypothetical protein ACN38_g8366 [Penicillium nordicum]|uniref:Uncharacterized protein n=1 Tax=Penicillium nordicum TaxID=229535 RepID=A0A0M8P3T5_9EURO|nr:hypothetical protein ACN38_g8366 [Penicillium nordicum]